MNHFVQTLAFRIGISAVCIITTIWLNPLQIIKSSVIKPEIDVMANHTIEQQNETPEQVVNALLSLPHGLNKLSPEDRARLRRVTENPKPHVDVLNSIFAERDLVAIQKPEDIARFERAIALLGIVRTNDTSSQLAKWYKAFDTVAAGGTSLVKIG